MVDQGESVLSVKVRASLAIVARSFLKTAGVGRHVLAIALSKGRDLSLWGKPRCIGKVVGALSGLEIWAFD